MALSGAKTAAAAGECGSEAGGESRARFPEERWKTRNGLSFRAVRIGEGGWGSDGEGVALLVRSALVEGVMMAGMATSFLRLKRGKWSMSKWGA